MTKQSVTFSCGHEGMMDIPEEEEAKRKKMWWVKNKAVCRDCYAQQGREKIKEMFGDLPELRGTSKQIEWASRLRERYLRGVLTSIETDKVDPEFAVDLAKQIVRARRDSKWWIDCYTDAIPYEEAFQNEVRDKNDEIPF